MGGIGKAVSCTHKCAARSIANGAIIEAGGAPEILLGPGSLVMGVLRELVG